MKIIREASLEKHHWIVKKESWDEKMSRFLASTFDSAFDQV